MSDPVNLATRLERLEATVADLAARLAALEAQPRAAAEPVTPSDEELNLFHLPDGETLSGIPALAGRSCLVLGGAFLVRSLTEAGVVSAPLGVALGLAYAAVWLLLADRAAGAGRTASATFHALAAALIATSQLLAGVIIAVVLAIPLIVRLSFLGNYLAIIHIFSGAIFVVSLASLLGIVSGEKKLFEILFFILTYANANRIPFTDYFGAIHPGTGSILLVMLLSSMMVTLCYIIRGMEIRSA